MASSLASAHISCLWTPCCPLTFFSDPVRILFSVFWRDFAFDPTLHFS